MTDDLRESPFKEQKQLHWLYRLYDAVTLPFTIYFLLSSPAIHPDYRMNIWRRFRFGLQLYRNTFRIWTGLSYRAHLAMAAKLFEIPRSEKGVVVECGCYRGGTTANLSLMCRLAGRELYVYDSFEGLPAAVDGDKYASPTTAGFLDADIEQVKAHVAADGAPEVCTFVKGWFSDTTPHHSKPIVVLFLDVDFQSSLTDCILNLWPHLVDRGFCFTDECILTDYCALFWSEKFWSENFDRVPPGLMGSGTGVGVGGFYLGPWGTGNPLWLPVSIAYTRKHWTGYWNFYPDEIRPEEMRVALSAQEGGDG